ncbi:V-type ATP synthase subunit D [candidate division KSB1 bacterium]|nr:V-type ATP synthase subunit D [candidate division KSB1 bacterium]
MEKIKYTKNELKKQKDNLKRYTRYLPTLDLKKQQLLVEIRHIQARIDKLNEEIKSTDDRVARWVDVFAEEIELDKFYEIKSIDIKEGNIAGIDIPIFDDVIFDDKEFDSYEVPLWVDRAVDVVKEQIKRKAALDVAHQQEHVIREELRVTIQRIKLFEEVKIPEARENIRVIRIFLGDQMTAEVVRGKIAKAKIEKKKLKGNNA